MRYRGTVFPTMKPEGKGGAAKKERIEIDFSKVKIEPLFEEEVRLLFFDRRFPSCNFGRKEVVEIYALISFFAKKERVLRRQEL